MQFSEFLSNGYTVLLEENLEPIFIPVELVIMYKNCITLYCQYYFDKVESKYKITSGFHGGCHKFMGHVKSHFSWVTNITRIIQTGSYLIHDAKITTKSEFCQMVSFSIHSPSTFDIASKKPRALVYSVPIRPRLKTMKDIIYMVKLTSCCKLWLLSLDMLMF